MSRVYGTAAESVDTYQGALTKEWIKASFEFDNYVWPQKDLIVKVISAVNSDIDLQISDSCASALTNLTYGLQTRKSWAYKGKTQKLIKTGSRVNH